MDYVCLYVGYLLITVEEGTLFRDVCVGHVTFSPFRLTVKKKTTIKQNKKTRHGSKKIINYWRNSNKISA